MKSYKNWEPCALGPYKPNLILHGGAGAISRTSLPPELWARYEASLLQYLTLTRSLLDSGATALDAACHAVTLFEDDPLFNCGRGAVFTEQGTIELEASVMVASLDPAGPPAGSIKRGAAVSLVKNTRHPILLAKEVLVAADDDGGLGGTSGMHCHLSGRDVEEWGWRERALQKKPDQWFWTKKRWEEHRRGLGKEGYTFEDLLKSIDPFSRSQEDDFEGLKFDEIPSQGTVGAVCLDSWGNLAVATSTGGLTNKKAGRIGDTPTIGSGFWAETWQEAVPASQPLHQSAPRLLNSGSLSEQLIKQGRDYLGSCLGSHSILSNPHHLSLNDTPPPYSSLESSTGFYSYTSPSILHYPSSISHYRRRGVAMSGTGNGDSFLRTNAVRSAAAISRFSQASLGEAVTAIAGPGGELQKSAGNRWGTTGEGQGGIIGIEVVDDNDRETSVSFGLDWKGMQQKKKGKVLFNFNCGGLFRAYYEDAGDGPRVMVFEEDY